MVIQRKKGGVLSLSMTDYTGRSVVVFWPEEKQWCVVLLRKVGQGARYLDAFDGKKLHRLAVTPAMHFQNWALIETR